MNRAAEQKKEAIGALRTILQSIFPFTSDEKQLLVSIKAQEKDESKNNENTSPSPNPVGDTGIHEENVIRDGWVTSSPTVAPVETPQPISYPTLTLIKAVELKDSVGHVIARLQPGQSLPYRYRDGFQALVLYQGSDYPVRISSTDLK
jgi:hypothetical protein